MSQNVLKDYEKLVYKNLSNIVNTRNLWPN